MIILFFPSIPAEGRYLFNDPQRSAKIMLLDNTIHKGTPINIRGRKASPHIKPENHRLSNPNSQSQ
jgi:hypothetical protein